MNAEEARTLSQRGKMLGYIQKACLQGKQKVEIPIRYVDYEYLEENGYRVSGGNHQRSETCTVSWERHWRD